jgi:hypothetical protein
MLASPCTALTENIVRDLCHFDKTLKLEGSNQSNMIPALAASAQG